MKVQDIDEVLCSPGRLAIMATLMRGESVSFSRLKAATGLADGNLHVQVGRLEEAGYLTTTKVPDGRRTRTTYRVSEQGQVRFHLYFKQLEGIIHEGEGVIRPTPARERRDDSQVWS